MQGRSVEVASPQLLAQLRHLRLGQPSKSQVQAAGRQLTHRVRDRRSRSAGVGLAAGGDHRQTGTPHVAAQEPQQPQRSRIGPLQIIDHHQQRARQGCLGGDVGERVEQPKPGSLSVPTCWHAQQLAERSVISRRAGRLHTHGAKRSQHLQPRPERWRAVPLPARRPHRPVRNPSSQFTSQPGLAHTRLPRHQHHPGKARQPALNGLQR